MKMARWSALSIWASSKLQMRRAESRKRRKRSNSSGRVIILKSLSKHGYLARSPTYVLLRRAIREFSLHFHRERNHQGLANRLIEVAEEVGSAVGEIRCRERLGGLLHYYYRQAA